MTKEESISLEVQEAVGREYAERQGHTVVAVYADPGVSGRTFKRPGVQRALAAVESGEIEVLILWKWSRLSRARLDWAVAVGKVESAGGRIESATEPLDTSTSSGRFARGVLAELAAFESERTGDVWKETHANRVGRGLPHSGGDRFGYRRSEGRYVPDEETAPVLRDLYRRFTAGEGFIALARLSGAHGGPSSDHGVRYMLDSGFGAGKIRVRGDLLPGSHEPVVSEAEFAAYLTARRARAKRPRAERSPHPYSGLVACWCGLKMAGTVKKLETHDTRYACPGYRHGRDHTNTVAGKTVDRAVRAFLEGVAQEVGEKTEAVRKAPSKRVDARPKLRAEVSKASARLDALTVKYLDGDVDKEAYGRLQERFRSERDDAQERLDALEAQAVSGAPQRLAADLLGHWDAMPAPVRREILGKLVSRLVVGPPTGRKGPGSARSVEVVPVWEQ